MCQAFIPLVTGSNPGRIVNLSSFGSALTPYSAEIQARFRDPKLTLEGLEGIAQEYQVCLHFTPHVLFSSLNPKQVN